MKRGRILILGKDKESAYELRSLFDEERFELEIALSDTVAKAILSERLMDLVIVDSQMVPPSEFGLFEYVLDRDIQVPILVVGPRAGTLESELIESQRLSTIETVRPFPREPILSYVKAL